MEISIHERVTGIASIANDVYLLCSAEKAMKIKDFLAYVHSKVFASDALKDDFEFHEHFRDYDPDWVSGETDIELCIRPESTCVNRCYKSNIIGIFEEPPLSSDTVFSKIGIVWGRLDETQHLEALEDDSIKNGYIADWLMRKYRMEKLFAPVSAAISDEFYEMHEGQREFNTLAIVTDRASSSKIERTVMDVFSVEVADDLCTLLSDMDGNSLQVLLQLTRDAYERIELECGFPLKRAKRELDELRLSDDLFRCPPDQYANICSLDGVRKLSNDEMLGGCFDTVDHSFIDVEFFGFLLTPDELHDLFNSLKDAIENLKLSGSLISSSESGIDAQVRQCGFTVTGKHINLLIYS